MKSVLDVESKPDLTLSMPRPIAQLLSETEEKDEDTVKRLEEHRRQIQGMIRHLQKNLGTVEKRLQTLNQQSRAV